ncbi:MAG: hypothetical protein KC435_12445 [Thermomicrobiales bacterium]|nr:hypothetical protein [Thermomicrobiales bacterium]
MSKRYAIIGDIVAEDFGESIHPGAAGAIALSLRDLGGEVTLRSCIGDDDAGTEVLQHLKAARIHPKNIDVIEGNTCALVRHEDGSFTDWQQGALMTKGGVMDIYALFGHDALVLDLLDQSLRHFLTDLPAHTDGTVRMATTLRHLDHIPAQANELEIAMRCDTIIGTEEQYTKMTGLPSASEALGEIFAQMPFAALRAAIAITPDGLQCVARDSRIIKPVQDAIPNLLAPRVAAAVAWGMAHHADWDVVLNVALDADTAQ